MPRSLTGLAAGFAPGIVSAVILAGAGVAAAQTANATAAETLFREGKRLLESSDYAHACPKLAESYRLDPATGALLALAVCHEGAGKLASAWAAYGAVAVRSKAEGRGDRERAARERVAALEPKLSMLTISVSAKAEIPGLRVRRDGEEIARAVWGIPVPVDAGTHTIDAVAPARKPWRLTVTVGGKPERRLVSIPPLEAVAMAASAASTGSPLGVPRVASSEAPPAQPGLFIARQGEARSTTEARPGAPALRTAGLVVAGAGLLGLGVGGVFAWRALDKKRAYQAQPDCEFTCPDLLAANSAGRIATGFTVAGLIVSAAGTTMWLLGAHSRGSSKVAVRIAPVLAAGAWRLGVDGRF